MTIDVCRMRNGKRQTNVNSDTFALGWDGTPSLEGSCHWRRSAKHEGCFFDPLTHSFFLFFMKTVKMGCEVVKSNGYLVLKFPIWKIDNGPLKFIIILFQ